MSKLPARGRLKPKPPPDPLRFIEPKARAVGKVGALEVLAASIAISLKRIADQLDEIGNGGARLKLRISVAELEPIREAIATLGPPSSGAIKGMDNMVGRCTTSPRPSIGKRSRSNAAIPEGWGYHQGPTAIIRRTRVLAVPSFA